MSATSRSGTSRDGKWPPRSNSDQWAIRPSASIVLRTIGSAAKTAQPVGVGLWDPQSCSAWNASQMNCAAEPPERVNQ